MKIKSIRYIGKQKTYSPEMASQQHNYITGQSDAIHANSHAIGYVIIAYRCLWLKSHYPSEWWAAVMSNSKQDKLIKYVGIAKSEGVKFITVDFNNLHENFHVDGDVVTVGLGSIKGIGSSAKTYCGKRSCQSLDEFVHQTGKSKIVMQRLIRLGAFDKTHPNRKALWFWYMYKYGSCSEAKEIKKEIEDKFAWDPKDVQKEIERLKAEYRSQYPKRNKIPNKILAWKPKHIINLQKIEETVDDYTLLEKLEFEKEYFGYYWTSPISLYHHNEEHRISDAKEKGVLECVIESIDVRRTTAGAKFLQLSVTDGVESAKVVVWPNEMELNDTDIFKLRMGIRARVSWRDQYNSFSIQSGTIIIPLEVNESAVTN